ncbi:MAG TPA: aquaporin [Thermoplasmata archaeon]|nr:aquaporin [Thermoplasmata archaeon]
MEAGWGRKVLGEAIGAFALVVVGAGSVLAANAAGSDVLVYATLGHAFVIAVMATALGPISGGQITPAVTLGLIATRRIKADLGAAIIIFQLIGSVIGGLLLSWLYPAQVSSGLRLATPAVNTAITPLQATVVEIVITFFLVFVVFATAIDARAAGKSLGAFPIGFTVGIGWFFGGALTGAAMSPGRWIGPAVASGFYVNWWVYWVGPLLGGVIAALVYEYAFRPSRSPS